MSWLKKLPKWARRAIEKAALAVLDRVREKIEKIDEDKP